MSCSAAQTTILIDDTYSSATGNLPALRITRYRKWHEISTQGRNHSIENWIYINLERDDYIIVYTGRLVHYKFRDHAHALMCYLAFC